MESNDFEKAFSDFIDRREYDEAQNALLGMVRISFNAGWQAHKARGIAECAGIKSICNLCTVFEIGADFGAGFGKEKK